MTIPFVSIDGSQLGGELPRVICCPMCDQDHQIYDSLGTTVDSDGNKKTVKGTLQFYKCGEGTFLAGMHGKELT